MEGKEARGIRLSARRLDSGNIQVRTLNRQSSGGAGRWAEGAGWRAEGLKEGSRRKGLIRENLYSFSLWKSVM